MLKIEVSSTLPSIPTAPPAPSVAIKKLAVDESKVVSVTFKLPS